MTLFIKKMTYHEFVKEVASKSETSQNDTEKVLKAMTDSITKELGRGEKITIPNLGTFSSQFKVAEETKTPKGVFEVPDRFNPKFRFSKPLVKSLRQN